jgi:hypothetical protein
MRTQLLAAIAMASLVGCVGAVDPSGPGTDPGDDEPGDPTPTNPAGGDLSAAKQLFDDNVFPILNAKCAGSTCHATTSQGATLTRFVAPSPADGWEVATGYVALVGNFTPDAAPILTQIEPGHQSVLYEATEVTKITEWLNKEVELRNGQSTTPTPGSESLSAASERVLAEFGGCMTLDDFQQADMADAWGNLNAQNNQNCENCHATGGEGFVASRNETFMWDVFSNRKYYFLQYLTVDLLNGAAEAKVIMNRASFLGVSRGQAPHIEHPTFNAQDNNGMDALEEFYNLVMARKTAGLCGAPKPFAL